MRGPITERGPYMITASGVQFHFLDPREEDVKIEDIAHHLSRLCRFTGAVNSNKIYTVAQHSLIVSELCESHPEGNTEMALEGLLHDASEAYIGDVSTPLKSTMHDYAQIAGVVDVIVRRALGLRDQEPALVKQIDRAVLMPEKKSLLPAHQGWGYLEDMGYDFEIVPMDVPVAHGLFLARYTQLRDRLLHESEKKN